MIFFNPLSKRARFNKNTRLFISTAAMACAMLPASRLAAQSISLTAMGAAYTQDFNTLSSVAGSTTNVLAIPGWSMIEYGNGARDNDLYGVDTGGSTTGDTYSYGSAAATDRALGELRSGTLIPYFGASFTNNTGSTITSLVISFTGEEWRLGTAGRADQLNFEYSLDAVDISTNTATWNGVSALTFTTPDMATVGAKNGNAAADRTALTATVTVSIANGATFWIRWNDVDAAGADDGLAIDDFTLTPMGGSGSPEIDVQGNATSISSGDLVPSVADATDFGSLSVCTGTVARTFSILNTGAASLNLTGAPVVSISGANAADFTVTAQPSGPVAASGSVSFSVVFDPSAAGIRSATITIANDDSDENPYVFAIQGTGVDVTVSVPTQTDVSCNGGTNGAASVTASGNGTLSYDWTPGTPTGDGTASVSGLGAGDYTVTVTDAGTCSATQTLHISEPSTIAASVSTQSNVSCFGANNGSATIAATGGTGSLSYSWAPAGGTAATGTNLTAGNYTVTVTDANSCTATQTLSISEPSAIVASVSTQSNVSCFGANNGSATIAATGGTGSLSYSWAPAGGTAATGTNLTAGNYTVTVTDANSCTATQTLSISEPSAIVATATQTNASCGNANGAASVSASGGTGSLSYSWTPSGGTAATATNLGAGMYTVTISDAAACSVTQTVNIISLSSMVAATTQTDVTCHGGNDGAVSVNVTGGTPAYTYSWSPSGGSAATASNLAKGNYTCTITDNTGCSTTATVAIHQPATINASFTQSNVTCNGGADGSVAMSATGGTGTLNFMWMPGAVASASLSNAAAGVYTCTISDANSCSVTQTVNVTEPTALMITSAKTDATCNGQANGTANISVNGGTPLYSYSWTPSGGTNASAPNLGAGTYTCFIVDANLCPASATVTISEPAAIVATTTQTNSSCGNADGAASVSASGGTGSLSYNWMPSGGNASAAASLSPGVYTLTISDALACSVTQTVNIASNSSIVAAATATDVTCNGSADGSAFVSVTGGVPSYTYSWSPSGGSGATATNLASGDYTCTITDNTGCLTTATVAINQPSAITAGFVQTNVSCNGGNNGSAIITGTGGTGTLSYLWMPGSIASASLTGLPAGVYTCTISDANSCSTTQTVTITEPAALVATATQTNVTCNGLSDGAANVSASGGTGALSYAWMPSGGNAAAATNLAAGDYTVTISDANSCSTTQTVTITEPTAIVVSAASNTIMCNGGVATITVSASGGSAPYTGVGTYTAAAGTYTYPVTDNGGCTASTSFTVTEPAALASSQTMTLCAGQSLTVGANTYTATGTYTDLLTGINGCDSTVTTDLTVNMPVDVTTTSTGASVSANASPASYQWIDCNNGNSPIGGETNQVYTPAADGSYAVIVTVGTCSATSSCVTVLTTGIQELDNASIDVYPNPNDGNFTVNLRNSGSYVLQLSDVLGKTVLSQPAQQGKTLVNAQGLPEGVYTLTVSGVNGVSTRRLVITK